MGVSGQGRSTQSGEDCSGLRGLHDRIVSSQFPQSFKVATLLLDTQTPAPGKVVDRCAVLMNGNFMQDPVYLVLQGVDIANLRLRNSFLRRGKRK